MSNRHAPEFIICILEKPSVLSTNTGCFKNACHRYGGKVLYDVCLPFI